MKRILICDDEPHIVEGLRHLLKGPGREIVLASDGKAAVELARQSPPDLLIIDLMMPVMNGLEAIATLRAEKTFQKTPIIILTAKGCEEDSVAAEKLWGATVVAKPFRPALLRELVTRTLEEDRSPAINSI